MVTFSCPAFVLMIGYSFDGASSSLNSVSFCTTHMEYPWILPTSIPLSKPIEIDVSLPAATIAYQANLECIAVPSPSSLWMEEEDPYVVPAWAVQSSLT